MSDIKILQKFQELSDSNRDIRELSEINSKEFMTGDLNTYFTVRPGVRGGQQLATAEPPRKITRKLGTTARTAGSYTGADVPVVEQRWNPQLVSINKRFLPQELAATFTSWLFGNGGDVLDFTGTQVLQFITDYIVKGAQEDTKRLAYHAGGALTGGGTANKNAARSNVLALATDVPDYNQIDRGLVETLKHWRGISQLADNFIPFTKNGDGTTAGTTGNQQFNLNTNADVRDILQQLVVDGNRGVIGDTVFLSDQLYYAYLAYRETKEVQGSWEVEGTGNQPMYRGKNVIKIPFYDEFRRTDFSRLYGSRRHVDACHFALYCDKSDLLIGVDNEQSLTSIRVERPGGDDDYFYIKGEYFIDFKFAAPFKDAFRAISLY